MNLQPLFEMQRALDAHIDSVHPPQAGEYRISKKVLALLVELSELANELPEVFKFWSNKKNDTDKALKEYVDALHFFLSIGIDLGVPNETEKIRIDYDELDDAVEAFRKVMRLSEGINGYRSWWLAMGYFIDLGELLGFTWEQVEQAYMQKNETNHARQNNGY